MVFLGKHHGLETKEAQHLYDNVIVPLRKKHGFLDVHTHYSEKQLLENKPWENVLQFMFLDQRYGGFDHYAWQMAVGQNGGADLTYDEILKPDADPKQLWDKLSVAMVEMTGNHVFNWFHKAMRMHFGINTILQGPDTAEIIWNEANNALKDHEAFNPRALLERFKVGYIGTTDDVLSDLADHTALNEAIGDTTHVSPTFRPDDAMHVYKGKAWKDYVTRLVDNADGLVGGVTLPNIIRALEQRHDFFHEAGCRMSDHGLPDAFGFYVEPGEAVRLFNKFYNGPDETKVENMNDPDVGRLMSYMMHEVARMDKEKGWTMLVHYGPIRSQWGGNSAIPPDRGGDFPASQTHVEYFAELASTFAGDKPDDLNIVLFPNNPEQWSVVNAFTRSYGSVGTSFPWWWADNDRDMNEHLGGHLVKNTSRKYMTFPTDGRLMGVAAPRQDYGDRSLANQIGHRIHIGELPDLQEAPNSAVRMIANIAYDNAARAVGRPTIFNSIKR